MSEREDRLDNAREHVKDAHNELYALPEEERNANAAALERLDKSIGYATIVLDATDADLLTANAATAIVNAAYAIGTGTSTALQSADSYGDALLDAVALVPAARDRDLEQQVKDAAATFQRSAGQRLSTLNDDLGGLATKLGGLKTEIDANSAKFTAEVTEQAFEFETKLTELDETITGQRLALDQLMTQQTKAFAETQEEQATDFGEALEKFRAQLATIHQQAQDEVDQRVAEIRRMEEESSRLVGAIGLAGTAERYSVEAKEQRKAAFWLQVAAIVVALGAVPMAIVASLNHDQSTQHLVAKLAVSAILGGLAAYLARQSGRHRRREEHARSLQLELTAFSPFIEPLSPEQQEEERVIMTRKTFGKTTAPGASDEEPGPAPLSFLLQKRRKQLEAGLDEDTI